MGDQKPPPARWDLTNAKLRMLRGLVGAAQSWIYDRSQSQARYSR